MFLDCTAVADRTEEQGTVTPHPSAPGALPRRVHFNVPKSGGGWNERVPTCGVR